MEHPKVSRIYAVHAAIFSGMKAFAEGKMLEKDCPDIEVDEAMVETITNTVEGLFTFLLERLEERSPPQDEVFNEMKVAFEEYSSMFESGDETLH
ncbi:hypothetical protein [Thioalkalivibrio sp. HK1]|uniref:hypothetical protein n=1 Tax=Thioalkalivibrio sp. HK1 TaxID=1469245 RepID=UPI0012DDADC3|nr:hypothetical protein [Thioalkalivibrio sp. HK1]